MTSANGPVAVERNLLVPLSDGVELAADLYRPDAGGPWPAILTFIPYHKDGRGGRLDVEAVNRYFAARGYAALTVDFDGFTRLDSRHHYRASVSRPAPRRGPDVVDHRGADRAPGGADRAHRHDAHHHAPGRRHRHDHRRRQPVLDPNLESCALLRGGSS